MARPATVTFHRPKTLWPDLLRSYVLVIDGNKIGNIRRGRNLSVEVEPGKHIAQARIDWTGSAEVHIEVSEGSEIHLRVEPGGSAFGAPGRAVTKAGYLRLIVE